MIQGLAADTTRDPPTHTWLMHQQAELGPARSSYSGPLSKVTSVLRAMTLIIIL